MKKRKITIISLIIACITSLSVAVGSVFAWFFNSKTYDFDVEGGVIASYYESGDGTIDSPYEIARPIQLYYFAWLQDLGFYNGKEGFADPPYYFRVSHDLDMKDFVIPPIGTSENPFIGVFDGENHVISNLKVSNDALTDSASENATIAQAQILGFFGIVGDYDGTYSAVSSQTSVSNFALDNLTVSSQNPSENKTLVGLVAGYVNGSVNNVYVASNSTVNIKNGLTVLDPSAITANFSDYALVGYCSTAYRKTFDSETTSTSPLFDPAKGNGWGGSIDMETLYNRLIAVRSKLEEQVAYTTNATTVVYDTGTAKTYYGSGTKTSVGHYDTSYTDENGENITGGSYTLAKWTNAYSDYSTDFNYLHGYTDKFRNRYITYNIANETDLSFYIYANGYYLNRSDATSVTGETSGSTRWQLSNDGLLYFKHTDNRYYFLRASGTANNSTLSLLADTSTNTFTEWEIYNGVFRIKDTNSYLGYNDGWKIVTDAQYAAYFPDEGSFLIYTGGDYLRLSGASSFANATANNATYFKLDDAGHLYGYYGGNTYYINRNGTNLSVGNSGSTVWSKDENTVSIDINGVTYYIGYDNGWKLVTEITPTVTFTAVTVYTISSGTHYLALTGTNSYGDSSETNATYWSIPTAGGSGTISTTYNGTVYYMYSTGANLSVRTNSTTWHRNNNDSFYVSYTSGWRTRYNYISYNRAWTYASGQNNTNQGYTDVTAVNSVNTISSGSNYLNLTGNNAFGNGTNANGATRWKTPNSGASGAVSTTFNNRTYYLNASGTALSVGTTQNTTWARNANGALSYTSGTTTYYLTYDGSWKLINASEAKNYVTAPDVKSTANDKVTGRTIGEQLTEYTGETYFPIITEGGTDEYNDATEGVAASDKYLVAHEKNTGYIISGGSQDGESNYNGFRYGQGGAGNIRVSRYDISRLDTSENNGTYYALTTTYNDGNVYSAIDYSGTITGYHPVNTYTSYSYAGATLDDLKFVNFVSARRNLNKLFDGASSVYGLHFMSATIDVNNKMVAPEVLVNGDTYTNYELPRNSIDFNLKEQGYITFFAGSYFSKNEAFFSLHNIYRNNDATHTLKSIYEIQYVYVVTVEVDGKDVKYFFYQYKDLTGEARYSFHYDRFGNYDANKYYNHNAIDEHTGNYVEFTAADAVYEYIMSASGNKRSSWVLSFNTDWITAPARMVSDALFYFEIPANQGEYALGSVSGKTGAYLIYLDIAAYGETESENSQEVRTTVNFYDLPKGIQLIDSAATLPETLDEAKSTGAILTSGYSGEITVKYVGVNLDDEDNPTGTCKFDFETTSSATASNTEESDEAGYYDSAAGIKAVYPPDQDAISVKTGGTTYKLVVSKEAKVNVARLIVHDNINATDGYTTRTVTLQDFGLFDIADVFELDANGDILLDDKGQQVKKESFDKVTIAQMLEDESYKTVLSFTYSFTDAESDSLAITFKTKYVPYDKYDVVLTTNKNRQVTVAKGADMGDYEEVKITYNTSSVLTVNASSADSTEITLNP